MSLEVSPEMQRVIELLAEQSGTTEADVLRRAVALLKVVKDGEQRGQTPALIDESTGEVVTKIVGV